VSLAVDASSPTAAIGSGATTVTGAFTPPDNTLLVAFCAGDANNGSLDEDQTVVDSTTTTWAKKVLRNGNGGACVTVHYRRLSGTGSSPGSITATLTDSKGSVAKRIFPRVFIDAATGIAPDIGATAVSGSANVSLTTTVNNSWVWSIALTANAVLSAGTGCTQQDDFGGFDSGDAVQTESQTSLTATAGTLVTNGLSGTTTVPHNVAVEIIPGSAGASATPGPAIYAPARPPARTTPILLRSTLQDPPVLTSAQPYIVSAVRPPAPSQAILLRSTLVDPPVLTTPGPIVVAPPTRPPLGVVALLRSSLVDIVTSATSPQPLVVAPPTRPAAIAPPYVGRSTLADPPVLTTPQPLVVTPTVKQLARPPILLRSSLLDLATSGPIVITVQPAPPRATVLLLRSSLADAVLATAATPQPIVVVAQQPPAAGRLLLLAAPPTAACDCLVHRPNTGTVTRGSTGTVTRPNIGVVTRPCSC